MFCRLRCHSSFVVRYFAPDSNEWFKEYQAFSKSYDVTPRPPSPPLLLSESLTGKTQEDWEKETLSWLGGGGGRGWTKSRIIIPQEGLVLCKLFNTLSIAQNPPYPVHRRGANIRWRISNMAATSNTKKLTFISLTPLSQLISDLLSLRKILRIWRPNEDGASCAEFPRWRPPHAEVDTCSWRHFRVQQLCQPAARPLSFLCHQLLRFFFLGLRKLKNL